GLLVDGGQEDDRDSSGLLSLPDERGGFVAVHFRHEHIEQDDGEIVLQQFPQGQLAGGDRDDVAQWLEHFGKGEEISLVVVNEEDLRPGWIRYVRPESAHVATFSVSANAVPAGLFVLPIHTRRSANSKSMSRGFEM